MSAFLPPRGLMHVLRSAFSVRQNNDVHAVSIHILEVVDESTAEIDFFSAAHATFFIPSVHAIATAYISHKSGPCQSPMGNRQRQQRIVRLLSRPTKRPSLNDRPQVIVPRSGALFFETFAERSSEDNVQLPPRARRTCSPLGALSFGNRALG
jgi:hypothetical protein